jgi:hypothetical protein
MPAECAQHIINAWYDPSGGFAACSAHRPDSFDLTACGHGDQASSRTLQKALRFPAQRQLLSPDGINNFSPGRRGERDILADRTFSVF